MFFDELLKRFVQWVADDLPAGQLTHGPGREENIFNERIRQFMQGAADELLADRLNRDLQDCGACLDTAITGEHYELLTEKAHTRIFYNMKLAFQNLSICELCAFILMRKLTKLNVLNTINVIAGPRRGAGPLIQTLAHYLPGKGIRTILFDPEQDACGARIFSMEAHTKITPDDYLLFVDDAFTSGTTLRLCIAGCERHAREHDMGDPQVVAVAVAVNRAPPSWRPEQFMPAIPLAWAIRNPVEKHLPLFCPACKAGVKLVKV